MQPLVNIVVYYWTNLVLIEQGLGIEQQKQELKTWLELEENKLNNFQIISEFTDKHLKRTKPKYFPELEKAVGASISSNAKLVIVRLDGLVSQKKFADLLATPNLNFICLDKNLVTPQVLTVVRQYVAEQSKQHGDSIKRGLRLTTNKLGNPNAAKAITPFNKIKTENSILFALLLQPIIAKYQEQGFSQRRMVIELNDAGIHAPEGGKWVLSQLQKVLKRIAVNNSAIELSAEIEKNNYQEYSAADLISALNVTSIKPYNKENWDEVALKSVLNRNKTIVNILELYEFMQKNRELVNNFISDGKNLEQIALELNNKNIAVPRALLD